MKRYLAQLCIVVAVVAVAGCGSGDTPTANAPAARGVGGVPVMSAEQLNKLTPEKRAQVEASQAALQRAAAGNMQRKATGRMPSGG